jgi:hypothetical protein
MEDRLRQEAPPEEADKLRTAAFVLMGLRYSPQVAEQLFRGVTSMEESSTYQSIVAKGVAKGELGEARKILLRLGGRRFGPPDLQTIATIDSLIDVKHVEELTDRILDVSSWQELLAASPS